MKKDGHILNLTSVVKDNEGMDMRLMKVSSY